MFISPELFHQLRPDFDASCVHVMEGEEQKRRSSMSILGKRSRQESRDEDANTAQASPRKIRSSMSVKLSESPPSNAIHTRLPTPPLDQENLESFGPDTTAGATLVSSPQSDTALSSKPRQRRIAPKRRQTAPSKPQTMSTAPEHITATSVHLAPCHVCHKKPRLKQELEGYEDCSRCNERTCYICVRQCEMGCEGRKVCRKCCVEQGEDGIVHCLDCLEKSEDHEMEG